MFAYWLQARTLLGTSLKAHGTLNALVPRVVRHILLSCGHLHATPAPHEKKQQQQRRPRDDDFADARVDAHNVQLLEAAHALELVDRVKAARRKRRERAGAVHVADRLTREACGNAAGEGKVEAPALPDVGGAQVQHLAKDLRLLVHHRDLVAALSL